MIFTPRNYQVLATDYILHNNRCALWSGMGTGKTAATLQALSALQLTEGGKTLIIAPLRVAQSVWSSEVAKWSSFRHLTITAITGSQSARQKALQTDSDIHTINFDNLQWLCATLGDDWPWATVVVDEATRLKSFRLRQGSKRAQALSKVAFTKVNRFIELTGTPSPNGLLDLWGQLWFIDRGVRLGRTYSAFANRWFRPPHPNSFELVPCAHAQGEIQTALADVCLSIRAQDYFDLREPIIVDVPVELPPVARAQYEDMEKDLFLQIAGNGVEALNAASKTMKCLQLANGAIYTDDTGAWEEVHDAKLDALALIVEEANGMPVLVAYHFKSDLQRLKKRFPQGKELDKKDTTIRRWNAGKIPILFAHPASAGHGLNLQDGGNIIAIFGHWWDLEQYQQIIERIGPTRQLQAGHNRPVYIYNIRASGTIDDVVIERRINKRKIQDLLLEASTR